MCGGRAEKADPSPLNVIFPAELVPVTRVLTGHPHQHDVYVMVFTLDRDLMHLYLLDVRGLTKRTDRSQPGNYPITLVLVSDMHHGTCGAKYCFIQNCTSYA